MREYYWRNTIEVLQWEKKGRTHAMTFFRSINNVTKICPSDEWKNRIHIHPLSSPHSGWFPYMLSVSQLYEHCVDSSSLEKPLKRKVELYVMQACNEAQKAGLEICIGVSTAFMANLRRRRTNEAGYKSHHCTPIKYNRKLWSE